MVDPRVWPTVVAIVGPTAVGKSDLAIEVAQRVSGEVVNADAFQVYRGMDIGTAKLAPAQRRGIPHHLLDILDVTEELSVAQYQRTGRGVLADLARRGVPAVVVGGSGLYVRALLDDLRFPGSDPEIRARWEARLSEVGPAGLHSVLSARDPEAATHILPTNGRRIVRALEVGEITGEPFTAQLPADGPPLVAHLSIGLDLPREVLDARIEARVARMLDTGLIDEVRRLLTLGLRDGRTASRALGYPQVIDLLDGALDRSQAERDIVLGTRRFARRQQRWFHRDPRTVWLDATVPASSTASSVAALMTGPARRLGP
ncbi:MAG TPA: tRNA (adenosine(37)-N6)-dimethylallyltransferase MiaA [Dermatophilaceae bacterium]|nr:tRNA (adenosine(37)-N6)-dimethylallyltransferase MiaA [Dermatophilaceae bacterium]